MKTFLSRIQQFFSGNNEDPVDEHFEDLTEGDEGIDDFRSLEDNQISEEDSNR